MADKMTVPQMEAALPTMTASMARTCVAQLEGTVFAQRDKDSLDIINVMANKLRAKLKDLGEPVRLGVLGGDDAKFSDTQTLIDVLRSVADTCREAGKAELVGKADSLVEFLEARAADARVDLDKFIDARGAEVRVDLVAKTKQHSEGEEPGPTGPEATASGTTLAEEYSVDLRMVPFAGKKITKADVAKYIKNNESPE